MSIARVSGKWLGWSAVLLAAFVVGGCGGDDSGSAAPPPTATRTAEVPGPAPSATPTPDLGGPENTATPTATPLAPCPTAVAAPCASECGTLGGCCTNVPAGSGYACFDPSVQCGFPCPTNPANWIGDTPCGPAPGNDPSKACLVLSSPTPTATTAATATATPTPGGATPTPNPCPEGNGVRFTNHNPYPIWLAEAYQVSTDLSNIILPSSGDWKIDAGASVYLCLPSGWGGRFWPRTECHFEEVYANDPGYAACTSVSDCSTGHLCYGGRCMLDCSTGGTPFCQGSTGLGRADAVCVDSPYTGKVEFCGFPQGTVCKTGDCQGLYQCYGEWDGNQSFYGSTGPVSLFELTSNGPTNVNYDVSLVSGYNTAITAQPTDPSCYAPTCVGDLNAGCPPPLQVAEAPSATPGPVPCGGGFCQSGACVGDATCVVGCNDPSDQCAASAPAALQCDVVVPNGDGSTYEAMYATKGPNGDTMISANQGTPTCWGTIDCLPDETCNQSAIAGFPSGVGICLPADGGLPQPQIDCAGQSDVGKACGGYATDFTGALGYTCVSIGERGGDVACVPAYDPPVSGVGTLTTGSDGTTKFYSGTGSPLNPLWRAAAIVAGGGTTPWYETFSNTCPHQYGWTYDDHAGGFDCDTGGAALGFDVGFGRPPTPTP